MISKYNGRCKGCNRPYAEGDDIYWTKEDGAWCWDCRENPKPSAAAHEFAAKLGYVSHEEGMASGGALFLLPKSNFDRPAESVRSEHSARSLFDTVPGMSETEMKKWQK